jgi:hypothetical protein
MSKKPGRNDPCPCGSGKKYKRCCLPKDEADARELARQQTLFDDDQAFDEADFNEDGDSPELDIIEEDPLPLDVRAIARVRYARGFVKKLTDLEKGRGLRVTEWEKPDIPQAALDSIEHEELDALEGEWGNPTAADPIQVDIIDLETAEDIFSIEIFNRRIALSEPDNQEIRRIHRVCEALEAVWPTGRERSAEPAGGPASAIPIIRRDKASPTPAQASDLSSVLKQHRQQSGTCALCGADVKRTGAQKHLGECAPAHDQRTGIEQRLVHLRVTTPESPAYWLDVEVRDDARLEALDSFLRDIWLECCGHLSAFKMNDVEYVSRDYQFDLGPVFGGFGRQRPVKRRMNARLGAALPPVGERFGYEYDFGSTTSLQLRVIGERIGRLGRPAVRLLARNTLPVWPCAICAQPATLVCTYCRYDEGNPFVCKKHRREHACGEDEGFMPVVNSPRMGVCGYAG